MYGHFSRLDASRLTTSAAWTASTPVKTRRALLRIAHLQYPDHQLLPFLSPRGVLNVYLERTPAHHRVRCRQQICEAAGWHTRERQIRRFEVRKEQRRLRVRQAERVGK